MAVVVLTMVCLPQALSIAVNTGFILKMRKVGFTLLERKSSYLCLEFFFCIQIFFGFDSSGTQRFDTGKVHQHWKVKEKVNKHSVCIRNNVLKFDKLKFWGQFCTIYAILACRR